MILVDRFIVRFAAAVAWRLELHLGELKPFEKGEDLYLFCHF